MQIAFTSLENTFYVLKYAQKQPNKTIEWAFTKNL